MYRYTFIILLFTLIGCQSLTAPVEVKTKHQIMAQEETKKIDSVSKPNAEKSPVPNTEKSSTIGLNSNKQQISSPDYSRKSSELDNNTINNIKELSPLALFRELAYEKVWFNFHRCKSCDKAYVKLQIHLTNTGYIEHYKIVNSSGNTKLENAAMIAIRKAEPFPMPKLTEVEMRKAKILVINFAPMND